MSGLGNIDLHRDLVQVAWQFANRAHVGQTRSDGVAYITHPTEVVRLLVAQGFQDPVLKAAGYLHDVLEDTKVTEAELRALFPQQVVDLVVAVTTPDMASRTAKTAWMLERAPSLGPQGTVLKLADRYHNLWNCRESWKPSSQVRYARVSQDLLVAMTVPPCGLALAQEVRGQIKAILKAHGKAA